MTPARTLTLVPVAFAFLLAGALPVTAQTVGSDPMDDWWRPYDGPRRVEFSALVSYGYSSSWNDLIAMQVGDAQGGVHQQILMRDLKIGPEAGIDGAVTYWVGRHGFRVHAGYTQTCLTTAARCTYGNGTPPADGAALAVAEVPMDVWRYGVQGIVGLTRWTNQQVVRPYLIVGGGGVTYDPGRNRLALSPGSFETVVDRADLPAGSIVITDGTSSFLISTDELGFENQFSVTIGGGLDLRIPVGIGGVGLRLELVDQITSSPLSVRVARLQGGGRYDRGIDEIRFGGNAVHNLRLSAGLKLELGLSGPREEYDPRNARW
jgi:hypothetical protein